MSLKKDTKVLGSQGRGIVLETDGDDVEPGHVQVMWENVDFVTFTHESELTVIETPDEEIASCGAEGKKNTQEACTPRVLAEDEVSQSSTSTQGSQLYDSRRISELCEILSALDPDFEQMKETTMHHISTAESSGNYGLLQQLGEHIEQAIKHKSGGFDQPGQGNSMDPSDFNCTDSRGNPMHGTDRDGGIPSGILYPGTISDDYPSTSILKFYGKRGNGSSPVTGDVVERNPFLWRYHDQDGGPGGRGLVTGTVEGIKVIWAAGSMNVYSSSDLKIVGRIPQINVGDIVERGPDWKHGNQDGGPGGKGVVTAFGKSGLEVFVLWEETRSMANYRWMGASSDLKLVSSDVPREEHGFGESWTYSSPPTSPLDSIEDLQILKDTNNPSMILLTNDFVVPNYGTMKRGNTGDVCHVGVVRNFDSANGIVSVDWDGKITTHHYKESNMEVSLVLVACMCDKLKSKVGYRHYTRRVIHLTRADEIENFTCYFCRNRLQSSTFAVCPPFFCEFCQFCVCLQCYHDKPPPKNKIMQPKFCLAQSKKILLDFVSSSNWSESEVDNHLKSCKGDLVEAMKKYRESHPPAPVCSPPSPESRSPEFTMFKMGAAAATGDFSSVKRLIAQGVDVDIRTQQGRTALHVAAGHCHIELVKYLVLEANADVNAPDEDGDGPLAHCAQAGDPVVARVLLDNGAHVDMASAKSELTPLMRAAFNGREEVVNVLIEYDASLNLLNCNRESAVHMAVSHKQPTTLAILVSKGAQLNTLNSLNFTPLHMAAKTDSAACCNILLEANVDVRMVDEEGRLALHLAAALNSCMVLQSLLDHDASLINQLDCSGNAPLHLACMVIE